MNALLFWHPLSFLHDMFYLSRWIGSYIYSAYYWPTFSLMFLILYLFLIYVGDYCIWYIME